MLVNESYQKDFFFQSVHKRYCCSLTSSFLGYSKRGGNKGSSGAKEMKKERDGEKVLSRQSASFGNRNHFKIAKQHSLVTKMKDEELQRAK